MSNKKQDKICISRETLFNMATLIALGVSLEKIMLILEARSYWLSDRKDSTRYPYYLKTLENVLSKAEPQKKDWNRAGQAAIQIEKLGTHPTEEQLIRSFRKIISHTRA